MTRSAEAASAGRYVSRRYVVSLLARSCRLLREYASVGLAFLVTAIVWLVADSLVQGTPLVSAFALATQGFTVAVASLTVGQVTGRTTASRSALLRGYVVGTVLATVLLVLLPVVAGVPLAVPTVASKLGAGNAVFAVTALGGTAATLYLLVSFALVIPATLVDRVGPITGLRRGWAVAKTVRLAIVLVYAAGAGLSLISAVLARFVVVAVGQSTLGPTGLDALGVLAGQIPLLFLTLAFSFLYVDRVTDLEDIASSDASASGTPAD